MTDQPTQEQIDAARAAGEKDATSTLGRAPETPLLRVAWAQGFGQVDQLREAVQAARGQGATWRQIGEALGENPSTAETKYGSGLERMRRYRQRQRDAGDS